MTRVSRLRARAVASIGPPPLPNAQDLAHVTIEAQNVWSNFVRSYLISCVFSPKKVKGGRVTLGNQAILNPGDVVWAAAKAARGPTAPAPTSRREEPSWHDVPLFVRTAQALQCSHLAQIQSALSLQTRVLQDLPVFRNFYAHRNEESARKAVNLASSQYLIRGYRHPTMVLAQPAYRRTQAVILDWLDDMGSIMELLCD